MNSVLQETKECIRCGAKTGLHSHHVFSGTSCRAQSEKYGLKVWLCYKHHNGSDDGVHFNREEDLKLKRFAQRYYEEHIGTRDEFIRNFIRSYL